MRFSNQSLNALAGWGVSVGMDESVVALFSFFRRCGPPAPPRPWQRLSHKLWRGSALASQPIFQPPVSQLASQLAGQPAGQPKGWEQRHQKHTQTLANYNNPFVLKKIFGRPNTKDNQGTATQMEIAEQLIKHICVECPDRVSS